MASIQQGSSQRRKKVLDDLEFNITYVLVDSGLSLKEATEMDPIFRRAWYYKVARTEGYDVNWENGGVYKVKTNDDNL
jgi:hypothetical protein